MAAGTPVVATPNPGSQEVLDHGRFGLIVSEAQLGETLCALLTQPDLRHEYSQRGVQRATTYSWEKIAGQYEHVYQTVLRQRHRSGGA
jgi:glycosyltransferase involved in cell wall biosynthesis